MLKYLALCPVLDFVVHHLLELGISSRFFLKLERRIVRDLIVDPLESFVGDCIETVTPRENRTRKNGLPIGEMRRLRECTSTRYTAREGLM